MFTLNNYTEENVEELQEWGRDNTTYMIFGKEVGESGTPHLQGYFECNRRRLTGLTCIRFGENRWWVDVARGTGVVCRRYCSKGTQSKAEWERDEEKGANFGVGADVFEIGVMNVSKRGKRTDMSKVKKLIHTGVIASEKDLADMYGVNYTVYNMGCAVLQHRTFSPSRTPPVVYFLHGATGTGKSRAVADFITRCMAVSNWAYWKGNGGLQWFNGYSGQEIAWFDDFRFEGSRETFGLLLTILDRYHCVVPSKGGFLPWFPKFIIITSPVPFAESFASMSESEDLGQIERRITRSFNLDGNGLLEFKGLITQFLSELDNGNSSVPLDLADFAPFADEEEVEPEAGAEEEKGPE